LPNAEASGPEIISALWKCRFLGKAEVNEPGRSTNSVVNDPNSDMLHWNLMFDFWGSEVALSFRDEKTL
jgi:hypothetical protein